MDGDCACLVPGRCPKAVQGPTLSICASGTATACQPHRALRATGFVDLSLCRPLRVPRRPGKVYPGISFYFWKRFKFERFGSDLHLETSRCGILVWHRRNHVSLKQIRGMDGRSFSFIWFIALEIEGSRVGALHENCRQNRITGTRLEPNLEESPMKESQFEGMHIQ